MKIITHIIYFLFFLAIPSAITAQFYIAPGAQVQLAGSSQLTLKDIDLINNGNFFAETGTILFSGSMDATISGLQPIRFYNLQINKDPGRRLSLLRPVAVSNQIQFLQGLVDLNGNDLDLESTGLLLGESETNRIVGTAGGEVLFSTVLNSPSNANPGNLGAIISSSQNLGNVVIKRGHKVQSLTGSSILRYYNISPANNTALNATLRFNYSDAELNGLAEADLGLWRSEDGVAWTDIGVNTRDAAQNYAEKNAINSFSIWTLSITSAALPVIFAGVNLKCETNRVVLRWKTLQETNSSHFIVERNTGTGWVNIGKIPAAGFSGAEKSYEFAYGLSSGQGFYRIAQYDLDGQVKYTQVLVADCAAPDEFQAWPNPFFQSFTVKMNSSRSSNARLRVVDAKGALVMEKKLSLVNGLNQFKVDLSRAVPGTYWLTVEWPEDGKVKSMRLIKQ